MRSRVYFPLFIITLVAFWLALSYLSNPPRNTADRAVDFSALKEDEVIITAGLNRRERAFLAINYFKDRPPPAVGLFGNHMFMHFRKEAFGSKPKNYFFNYYYANLSLVELFTLLRYFEDNRMLPTGTIVVQLTPPNNDNGLHMLGFAGELPLWMIAPVVEEEWSSGQSGFGAAARRIGATIESAMSGIISNLYYETSYGTLLEALREETNWKARDRVYNLAHCRGVETAPPPAAAPIWRRLLNRGAATQPPADPRAMCSPHFLAASVRSDGSTPTDYADKNLVLDENPLDPREADGVHRKITTGDEEEIALYLRRTAAIGERNGVHVVFVIPPVYETERDGPGNRVLTRALTLVPDLNILDHRTMRSPRELFMRYDHPSELYFQQLADEMWRKGWLPD